MEINNSKIINKEYLHMTTDKINNKINIFVQQFSEEEADKVIKLILDVLSDAPHNQSFQQPDHPEEKEVVL